MRRHYICDKAIIAVTRMKKKNAEKSLTKISVVK
jgi:hypothetical protein